MCVLYILCILLNLNIYIKYGILKIIHRLSLLYYRFYIIHFTLYIKYCLLRILYNLLDSEYYIL